MLKAEEYKDISEIIEAAKRIERSAQEAIVSLTNHRSNHPTLSPPLQALFYLVVVTENPVRSISILLLTPGTILPKKKTPKNNNFGNPNRDKEVCRFWNKQQRPPCTLQDQSCKYGRLHKCFTCSKLGCKEIHHGNISKPTANSCEVRPPQDTHLDPSTSAAPPPAGVHTQSAAPPLFMVPTLPSSSNDMSVNLNRTILSCQVTSAGKSLQLPRDSCCSVTLCSLDHTQHIHSSRPE